MAIGLNDIKKNRQKRVESTNSEVDLQVSEKKRSLRPWESYDESAHRTRTLAAQEAVKRARIIVQKNNELSSTLLDRAFNKDPDQQDVATRIKKDSAIDISIDPEMQEMAFSLNSRRDIRRSGVGSLLKSVFGM